VLVAQQLTTLDLLLVLLHGLDRSDAMLAILAPRRAVMPWLLDATTALQAAPLGGLYSCAALLSSRVKAWIYGDVLLVLRD
jgi:hypothetical protein